MYVKVLLLAFFITLLQHAGRLIFLLGYHYTIFGHSPGPCSTVESVVGGSASLEMLDNGLVFISSGHVPGRSDRGRIYVMDLNLPDLPPRELDLTEDFESAEFWPHGLAAWKDNQTGDVTLFVISHHFKGDCVEKFSVDFEGNRLIYQHRIRDPAIRAATQILAVSADQFYLTNTCYAKTRGAAMLEFILMLPWGTLVHYDGTRGQVVARFLIPNGLALSSNNSLLYVSVAGGQEIRVYRRKEDNSLAYLSTTKIEADLADLSVDAETGNLWVAAANSASESRLHDSHPSALCGSRVFRLCSDKDGNLTELREAYASTGRQLSCASSVVYYHSNLLVGSPYRPPLICQVTAL